MNPTCPTCGGPLIQKSRARLAIVGVPLLAGPGLTYVAAWLWIPGIVVGLTGAYLLYWATAGRGRWCRQCKAVPRSR